MVLSSGVVLHCVIYDGMSLPGVSILDQTDNVQIVLDLSVDLSGVLGVSYKFDGQWHLSFSKLLLIIASDTKCTPFLSIYLRTKILTIGLI